MTSLADRRVRGDMIATYKIMTGKDKIDPGLFFDLAREQASRKYFLSVTRIFFI